MGFKKWFPDTGYKPILRAKWIPSFSRKTIFFLWS